MALTLVAIPSSQRSEERWTDPSHHRKPFIILLPSVKQLLDMNQSLAPFVLETLRDYNTNGLIISIEDQAQGLGTDVEGLDLSMLGTNPRADVICIASVCSTAQPTLIDDSLALGKVPQKDKTVHESNFTDIWESPNAMNSTFPKPSSHQISD